MSYSYIIRASYGNDSVALIQWAYEQHLDSVAVLYNNTGWARTDWEKRASDLSIWACTKGFTPYETKSIGLEQLVRNKKAWPRQGIQFCTSELKIKPTERWLAEYDPNKTSVSIIGVRREESRNRAEFPEFSVDVDGRTIWAPMVNYTEAMRNELLLRAEISPLPHRSMECFPCINSNRRDLLELSEDEIRIIKIEDIESSMGFSSKGAPRTMFRPYRYMGATGIREIVRWAKSDPRKFNLDDGNESPGCEAGWCGL